MTKYDEPRNAYVAKFKDPRWQKKRLLILQRDEFTCQTCFDSESTLNVHHLYYMRGADPWEYPDAALLTLCESCHETETAALPAAEAALVQAVKRAGFMSGDLETLARGFSNFAVALDREGRIAMALRLLFEDRDEILNALDRFDDFLSHTKDREPGWFGKPEPLVRKDDGE